MTAKEGVSYFGMMMKVILQKMWITLIGAAHFSCSGTLPEMAAEYRERSCHVDFCYRMFYLAYDKAECMDKFARLRSLVENIYTNQYLGRLLPAWSKAVAEPGAMRTMSRQRDFG